MSKADNTETEDIRMRLNRVEALIAQLDIESEDS